MYEILGYDIWDNSLKKSIMIQLMNIYVENEIELLVFEDELKCQYEQDIFLIYRNLQKKKEVKKKINERT